MINIKTILFLLRLRKGYIVFLPDLFYYELFDNKLVLRKHVRNYLNMCKLIYRVPSSKEPLIYFDNILDAAHLILKYGTK